MNLEHHKLNLTPTEYEEIPKGPFPDGYLELVPIGFRFIPGNDALAMGEVVKDMDMFNDQWPNLCVPEKGMRWYRIVLTAALTA